jgi:hypothetical protein
VSTVTPDSEKLRELDQELAHAWQDYYCRVQDLDGEAYEQAEIEAWEALQGQLRRIERRRHLLNAARPASG